MSTPLAFGFGGPELLILLFALCIALLGLIAMIWALVDITKSEFPGQEKLIWVVVVLFFGLIGTIIYLAVGRSRKIPPAEKEAANPFNRP